MAKEYFIIAGVLFLIYGFFRVLIGWELDLRHKQAKASDASGISNHAIDASPLADRVREVRSDYCSEIHFRPASATRPLLVENRRREIARLPYFRKPPPSPEPPDHEPGLALLLA